MASDLNSGNDSNTSSNSSDDSSDDCSVFVWTLFTIVADDTDVVCCFSLAFKVGSIALLTIFDEATLLVGSPVTFGFSVFGRLDVFSKGSFLTTTDGLKSLLGFLATFGKALDAPSLVTCLSGAFGLLVCCLKSTLFLCFSLSKLVSIEVLLVIVVSLVLLWVIFLK